ncbi:MAG TPA: glycoside hydrolase family 2 TIM barrel-domain containing protein, partial [Candidatus Dormibacteraeota bacterium]|nr:glycoside hydrolase family 2 TIM barrel-domain containing protein [Candidatus Dormibacteraeota bacterium]
MRLLLATACATFALALILSAAAAASPSPVELTHGWQFRFDPHAHGGLDAWRSGGPGGGWRDVSVPHVFDPRPLPAVFHGTIGWYRLRFLGPSTPRGFGWAFHFGAVRRSAAVWLNGRRIGTHVDPYASFVLPARGLKPGRWNVLVVRVVNRKQALPREGWWNWGGITRPVTLIPRGPVTLDDVAVMPKLSCPAPDRCSQPTVIVRGRLGNRSARRGQVAIKVHLQSPSGAVTSHTVRTSAPRRGQFKTISFRFPLSGPVSLWAPEHPSLYSAVVATSLGGHTAQTDKLDIGVRAVEVRNGLLYLNGRQLQVRGASIQEDVPGRGPALLPSDISSIVGDLKSVGANVTRAQYGLSDELMSALDRAGILLWNQAPVYHRDLELRKPEGRLEALAMVRHNILTARNHACVIANSVDNEPVAKPDARPGTRQFLWRSSRIAKRLDPRAPAAIDLAAKPSIPFQRSFTWFPLIGLNSYFGWYTGRPGTSVANFNDFEPLLKLMRKSYPGQALLITEFGAEATFDGDPATKGSFEFQSDYVTRTLDIVDRNPYLAGAIYWTLREFAVKPHWDGGTLLPVAQRDSIHHKGLLRYDGTPKPAWYVARERFTDTP